MLEIQPSKTERRVVCRVCLAMREMTDSDAAHLQDAIDGIGVRYRAKDIAASLAAEGYPDMYHPVKNHRFLGHGPR